jgi:general stress protein 26
VSDIQTMLAATARVIAGERSCWLVTRDHRGLPFARPMGALPIDPPSVDWTLRFLVDRRSGKSSDVAAEPRVTVLYQRADEAYVSLMGSARLVTQVTEIASRWQPAYDKYFPPGGQRENVAFVEVEVAAMHLWIREVTPEPFGMRTTELTRDASGAWLLGSNAGRPR